MLWCLNFIRELDMLGIMCRLLAALICGGIVGLEREIKRRPAGFRTHILICVGASLTTLTSQFILLELGYFTDLARLGAQVIAGIGFIGAGCIIVTKNRRVKGLTTAAGLWVSAIVGLCCGAGHVEAAFVVTLLILFAELVLSKLEYWIISTSRVMNLYVEYVKKEDLDQILEKLREKNVTVMDIQITKNASGTLKKPCAIFSLELKNTKASHLLTSISKIEGVLSVEEL